MSTHDCCELGFSADSSTRSEVPDCWMHVAERIKAVSGQNHLVWMKQCETRVLTGRGTSDRHVGYL